MYQQNQGDMFTNAVDVLLAATLRSADLIGSSNSTFSANLPASSTAVAYAAGGTYLGSALASTRGPGAGVQNDRTGSAYRLTTNAGGAITAVLAIQDKRDGTTVGGIATSAPTNPGVGPNIATAAQTIIFDPQSIKDAFGVTLGTDGNAITGALTTTLQAGDLQPPRSGTVAGAVESVYESDLRQGGGSFGIWIGTAGPIKLELAGAIANQTVIITAPAGAMGILARKIYIGANTTAAGILALY